MISGFSYNATSKKELKADFKEHLSIVWKEESKEELYSLGTETSQKTSGELVFLLVVYPPIVKQIIDMW
ncbi:hypothetical protein GQR36_24650 [Enterococcus termitis]